MTSSRDTGTPPCPAILSQSTILPPDPVAKSNELKSSTSSDHILQYPSSIELHNPDCGILSEAIVHIMPRREYKTTPLFGGTLVCDLPANFADVSTIRQVPDNQEVYIDKDGFTSIIFDITERVDAPGSGLERDGRALTTHLEDLVGDDADTVKVWNTTETQFTHLDESIPAYTLIATQTPHAGGGGGVSDTPTRQQRAGAPDFTALILTLVRLEKEQTDVLITINVPHIKGEYDEDEVDLALGKQGELIGDAVEHAAKIWATFQVKDWGLFDQI